MFDDNKSIRKWIKFPSVIYLCLHVNITYCNTRSTFCIPEQTFCNFPGKLISTCIHCFVLKGSFH